MSLAATSAALRRAISTEACATILAAPGEVLLPGARRGTAALQWRTSSAASPAWQALPALPARRQYNSSSSAQQQEVKQTGSESASSSSSSSSSSGAAGKISAAASAAGPAAAAAAGAVLSVGRTVLSAANGAAQAFGHAAKRTYQHARRTSAGQAAALQAAALWQAHGGKVSAAAALGAAYALHVVTLAIAARLSEFPLEHPAVATLAAAIGSLATVTAVAGYIRARSTVDPDRVYRLAVRKLNSHAGVLEVMGAPVAGGTVRAEIPSGGGVAHGGSGTSLSAPWPFRRRPRRVQMAFPVRGALCDGVAYVSARKRRGKYDFKLLAVELRTVAAAASEAAARAAAEAAGPGSSSSSSGNSAGSSSSSEGGKSSSNSSGGGGGGAVARVFLAGDATGLMEGSALRELTVPLARAAKVDPRHEVEDDIDAALGDWRPAAPWDKTAADAASLTGSNAAKTAAAEDLDQLTPWERAKRAVLGGRAYARKHWGVGVPMESPAAEGAVSAAAAAADLTAATAAGGPGGGNAAAAAGSSSGGGGATAGSKPPGSSSSSSSKP